MQYINQFKDYMIGSICVEVEGFSLEKFINNCKIKMIKISNIERLGETLIRINIPINEYKKLLKISKKNNCKCKIKRKKGFPFFIHKYRKRKLLVIVIFLIIVFIYASTKFIWNIDVKGNETISKQEILDIVKKEGIEIGKLKSKIETKNAIENLRIMKPEISWVRNKINWYKYLH